MKRIEFWITNKQEDFVKGSLENYMIKALADMKYYDAERLKEPHLTKLIQGISESEKHEGDYLYDIFEGHCMIDFEFGKNLQLYDIIDWNSFEPKTDLGVAIREIINWINLKLILYRRQWYTPEVLELAFDLCHEDRIIYYHPEVVKNGVPPRY